MKTRVEVIALDDSDSGNEDILKIASNLYKAIKECPFEKDKNIDHWMDSTILINKLLKYYGFIGEVSYRKCTDQDLDKIKKESNNEAEKLGIEFIKQKHIGIVLNTDKAKLEKLNNFTSYLVLNVVLNLASDEEMLLQCFVEVE